MTKTTVKIYSFLFVNDFFYLTQHYY